MTVRLDKWLYHAAEDRATLGSDPSAPYEFIKAERQLNGCRFSALETKSGKPRGMGQSPI